MVVTDVLYWLAVKSVQPDPPHIARAKRVLGDVHAVAQLTNLVLPAPPTPERKDGP